MSFFGAVGNKTTSCIQKRQRTAALQDAIALKHAQEFRSCFWGVVAFLAVLVIALSPESVFAQTLPLKGRLANAPTGTEFLKQISSLDLNAREAEIRGQIAAGNVPEFLRKLSFVSVTNITNGKTNVATFYVTPDYLAVGSDEDYYLVHISPNTAQRIADSLGCCLPTRKMVNDIYAAAAVKLAPHPMTPGPTMTTVPVFSNHNAIVCAQRNEQIKDHPLGALVAGHQKDLVIAAGLASAPGKVAIYGWHQTNGVPIQPLYLKHAAFWVDYSQCTRLVQRKMTVNVEEKTVEEVLGDVELSALLSDEGTISDPRYPTNDLPPIPNKTNSPATSVQTKPSAGFADFQSTNSFGERIALFTLEPEVKVRINAPLPTESSAKEKQLRSPKDEPAEPKPRKPLLILFALPNGNTTEQTIGKTIKPGDDWHYDIQHIGAQTRFLRQLLPERPIIVAYLENNLKAWPAWRKKYGDKQIPEIIEAVKKPFAGENPDLVLTGHSGGGSFTFGYLNTLEVIPNEVIRIAFLDSNYAYDPALGHKEKLVRWLKASSDHALCILAYNDAIALLDGKPFVSAAGGTWGKSHQMQHDFAEDFSFTTQTNADFQRFTALDGRVQFILKENPERKIFHTVQVERNGFIHAMVTGTPNENKGYEYFGARAYTNWVSRE